MRYRVTYQDKKRIKTKIVEADSKEEVFGVINNIIHIATSTQSAQSFYFTKDKKEETYRMFQQLFLMVNSGLPFVSAIDLLLQTNKNTQLQDVLEVIKELSVKSLCVETSLAPYKKYIGQTPIIFLKLGLENGNIKESLASLVEVLNEDIKTKKYIIKSIRYSLLLMVSLVIALTMIFIYVLPSFEFLFESLGDELPLSTQVLLFISRLISENFVYVFFCFILIFFMSYFSYKAKKQTIQKVFLTQIPYISKVLRYYYFYKFFLVMSIIIRSKYQFQTAIINSKLIISNEYTQKMIDDIYKNIKNGHSIASAFGYFEVFDGVIIKLLHTAEVSSNYEQILKEITEYNKMNFLNSIKNLGAVFEPLMVITIGSIVLWLILAIMTPIWNLSSVMM